MDCSLVTSDKTLFILGSSKTVPGSFKTLFSHRSYILRVLLR